MVEEDSVTPHRQRRWRWLVILLLLFVGVGLLLVRLASAPLATAVLNRLIRDQPWGSKEFQVAGASASQVRLVEVDFADGPWRFTA